MIVLTLYLHHQGKHLEIIVHIHLYRHHEYVLTKTMNSCNSYFLLVLYLKAMSARRWKAKYKATRAMMSSHKLLVLKSYCDNTSSPVRKHGILISSVEQAVNK